MSDEPRLGRSLPGDSDYMRGFMAGVRACVHYMPCFDAWAGSRAIDDIARGLLEGVDDLSQDPGEDLHTREWLSTDLSKADKHLSIEIAQEASPELEALLAPLIGQEKAEIASKALKKQLQPIIEKHIDDRIRLEPRTDRTPPTS